MTILSKLEQVWTNCLTCAATNVSRMGQLGKAKAVLCSTSQARVDAMRAAVDVQLSHLC